MTINSSSARPFARLAFLGVLALPVNSYAQGLLLRNVTAFDDEFRGYCLDVAGGGANARVDAALRELKYPIAAALSTVVIAMLAILLVVLILITRKRADLATIFQAMRR